MRAAAGRRTWTMVVALVAAGAWGCGSASPSAGVGSTGPLDVAPLDPGGDARFSAVSATWQTAAPGGSVIQAPAVRVVDAAGAPVAGAVVTFAVTGGGGRVAGSPATTDAGGIARTGGWTLGSAGAQSVEASSPASGGVTVTFSGQARDPGSGFDVTLWLLSPGMTDAQVRAFVNAKERVEQIVVGDLPPVSFSRSAAELAGCGGQAVDGEIDDVLVVAEVVDIDGAGSILGEAGPCFVRRSSRLPVMGHVRLDATDLARLEATGRLESVVLHEMLHVLGFGTVWTSASLLEGDGTSDPRFTGAAAREAFLVSSEGLAYAGSPVPVEAGGGAGTAGSHWRETVLGSELMTGWISGSSQPLSRATVASLGDLGYAVDLSHADPAVSVASSLRAVRGDDSAPPFFVGDDLRRSGPIPVDDDGRDAVP
jgi:hypothetical protein